MTKAIYTLILALSIQGGFAQIGINTENPRTLLHIDGASSAATTNPSTGNPSAAQMADDVVITNLGNVGIGTYAPTTKLDIRSATEGAIRIDEPNKGVNRVLMSDANGAASWGTVIGAWFALLEGAYPIVYNTVMQYRQIKSFGKAVISNSTQGAVNGTNGTITVPFTGWYRVNVNGHWGTNRINDLYLISPCIYRNGSLYWLGRLAGYSTGWGLSPTFMTVLSLNAGDVLTIYNDETAAQCSNMVDRCSLMVEFIQ